MILGFMAGLITGFGLGIILMCLIQINRGDRDGY